MFDYIKFKYPLPIPSELPDEIKDINFNSITYQTKDLENYMSLYVVDESGCLNKEIYEVEYLEPKDPKSKDFLDRLPIRNVISTELKKTQDTCLIRFYEYLYEDKYNNDYSIEYSCKVIDGQLDASSVKLVNFAISDNSERKANTKLWKEKLEANRKFHNKLYIKYTYGVYVKFVRFVFKNLRKVIRFLDGANWKIEKFLIPK